MLRKLIVAAFCMAIPLVLSAGEGGKLREIDTKDLKVEFEKGRWNKPTTFASAEELDKAIPGADAVKKKVDFTKEKLVLFAWGGSGGDKLEGKLSDDGKIATFTYNGGLTRDFRRHVHLYVLPKDAAVEFGAPKIGT